jgi:hypothetical protein
LFEAAREAQRSEEDVTRRLELYVEVMKPCDLDLTAEGPFVVRMWDGMDGAWCNVTGAVSADEALRVWAERTKDGTVRVAFAEIDYFRIFAHDTAMFWDGGEGREMHRSSRAKERDT